jgi:GDP-L-fucose synthase
MDLQHSRITVTGGHGFIGRHVVRLLEEKGVPKEQINTPRADEFDLRAREGCRTALQGADLVIHLAALTGSIEFHRAHPAQILFDNVSMNLELLEAAREAGVKKFVGIGSATEYPEHIPVPYREENLWDGAPEGIHAPYSFAKRMLLAQSQAYRSQYNLNAIHLLPANIYGPGETLSNGYVVPSLIRRFLSAKKENAPYVEVWGTGRASREFLYVEDVARGIILASEHYDKPEPVNLGSGEEISIKNLAESIARLTGYQGEVRWDTTKPDGQLRRSLDVGRAKKEFGFEAKTKMAEGLKATIAWHLENI